MLKKICAGYRQSIAGLRIAKKEKSIQIELASILLYLLFGYWYWPLHIYEIVLLIFSFLFVLIVECINTALELALERIHPERHDLIGQSKDVASAAVFLAMVFAGIVFIAIAIAHL